MRYLAQLFLTASSAAVMAAAPASGQTGSATTGSEAAQSSRDDGIGEIVVTAQRREQNLQDVPISVTALNAEAIEANRIQNVSDLGSLAPNTIVVKQPGGGNIPQFTIRGVAGTNSAPESDNPVSLYIDGVYIGRAVGAIFDLADIERIEVLKGPQGTLFGRNSTAGAVSITTSDPSGTLGGKIDGTIGNFDQRRLRASLDLPEWNGFSAKISYLHSERDGDIRNLGAGTKWDFGPHTNGAWGIRTSPETLGAENTDAGRIAIRYNSGDFDAVYKFDYTDSVTTANGSTPITFDPTGIIASQPESGIVATSRRPDAVNNAFTTPTEQKTMGHLFTVNFKASDQVSFKNILAYRTNKLRTSNQIDGAGGLTKNGLVAFLGAAGAAGTPGLTSFAGLNAGSIGDPVLLLGIINGVDNQQFTEEAQVTVDTDAFNLISGFFYFDENIDTQKLGSLTVFAQTAPGFVVPGTYVSPGIVKNKSYAIYSQGSYHITDNLDLTLGGRQTWDDRFSFNITSTPQRVKGGKFTYLAGLDYHPTEDILTYVKYSTGYVSGGILNGFAYEPELAKSLEGGVKADLLDRHLRVNVAAYHTTFEGVQFIAFDSGVQRLKNAGSAEVNGGEIEVTARPFGGLLLNGSLGYSDFKYTRLDPAIGVVGAYKPAFRPKITGNASIEYSFPAMSWGGVLSARADVQYQSRYDAVTTRSEFSVAPARAILGARVSLAEIPLGSTQFRVAAWGRNLTNNRSLTYAANLGLLAAGLYQPARTYGLDVGMSF